jgi:hypothetical protein
VVTPLEKFRAQYPKGALIADLVSVHEGQYVVRAAVIHQGETLATGFAASADIQVAEDRARERAIAVLAIPSAASKNGASRKAAKVLGGQLSMQASPEASADASAVTSSDTSPAATAPDYIASQALEDVDFSIDEEDLGPPIDVIEESAEERPAERLENGSANGSANGLAAGLAEKTAATSAAAKMPDKPSAAAIALENFSTSANPVDLSDVIAQTDVELTRLGWTSVQGREYLEKTYGKRSRQQLTDDELMSFLLYLEEQ